MDIHNFDKHLEHLIDSVKKGEKKITKNGKIIDDWSKVSDDNRMFVLKFEKQLEGDSISSGRIIKYIYMLKTLSELLGNKRFDKANKDDIINVVGKANKKNWSDWTKRDFKDSLKRFYKWLRNTDVYPEEVKWIENTKIKSNKLPKTLLTPEEVKTMAEIASNPRDKALVLALYESGCRIGELLTMTIDSVQPHEHGVVITVDGKTGMRRILLIASAPAMLNWLNVHPLKDEPSKPFWVGIRNFADKKKGKYEQIGYRAVVKNLENLAKMAGIKKKVNPHNFRHSRATLMANHLTDAQLKEMFGWTQDSDMAKMYIHMAGKNIDDALLNYYGLLTEKEKEDGREKVKTVVKCPRCKTANDPDSKFCSKCWLALDVKTAMDYDKEKDKILNLSIKELISDPKKAKQLGKLIDNLNILKEKLSK